uniref:Granulins domain-containing protein n=1 Tax=Kalanchoe fedtschenkoi TaxID=63787 RepID=A0A7N0SXI3_KALFE
MERTTRNSWGGSWGEKGYIRMERNVAGTATGKCGIAMVASYPIKKGQNPPNPGPSPNSEICTVLVECRDGETCCCLDPGPLGLLCFEWGCCPYEAATCCDDNKTCCPHDYPVCNTNDGTCLISKNNPMGVKALKRIAAAKRRLPFLNLGKRSSAIRAS